MKRYLVHVVSWETGEKVKTIDCGTSERKADRTEMGLLINMDTDRYGVEIEEVEQDA